MIASALVWLALALLVWLEASTAGPRTVRADFGATAAVIGIVTFLGNLFGFFGGGGDREARRGLLQIRDALANFGRVMLDFFRDVQNVLVRIGQALRAFWRDVIKPVLLKLDLWARRLFSWLRDTFGPIIQALEWLRKKVLEFYDKWFRPIFDTIDVIRRFLSVLSLFNVQWARELDAKLAALEAKLLEPIRLVVRTINDALDFLNRIVTLDGLLQRYTLLASTVRDIGGIAKIWHDAHSRPVTEADRTAAAARDHYKSGETEIREAEEYIRRGSGPDVQSIEEAFRDLELRYERAA